MKALQDEIDYLNKQLQQAKSYEILDVGFLFASPLMFRDGGIEKTFDQLDFQTEKNAIISAIQGSGKAIKFLSNVATKDNLSAML